MTAQLKQNLDLIETTSENWKQRIFSISTSEEPDYQIFNEIELHKQGRSPLIVIMGVENIGALRTIQSDLRRFTAIVAEPDLTRLKHLLVHRDLTNLLEERNIVFVAGDNVKRLGDQLEMYFTIAMIDSIKTIKPLESRADEFQEAFENLDIFRRSADANRSTVEKFLTDWHVYFAQNLEDYLNSPSLSHWNNALEGETVTIVGPGPSIDQEEQQLKTLADGWIIALDTALPLLNKLDIVPEIVVSVDVGQANRPFVAEFPNSSYLVCPAYMDPHVRKKAKEAFLFEARFPPIQWINRYIESPGYLPLSGSVSTAALGLVRMLNPAQCYLLGLDLTTPGFLTHSRQLPDYERILSKLNRFKTIPSILYQQIQERIVQTVETPTGPVLTTEQYLHWKEFLESMIERCEFPFFRLGKAILPMEGTKMTRRIHNFQPQSNDSLPVIRENRLHKPKQWKRRARELFDRIQQVRIELKTIASKARRGHPIENEWLQFAGSLGEHEEFLEYFQWEIDRLTQELQQIQSTDSLQATAHKQFQRWITLLEETEKGFKGLL